MIISVLVALPLCAICIAAAAALMLGLYRKNPVNIFPAPVYSFDDCSKAGYPIQESYPPRCTTPDGRVFVKYENNQEVQIIGDFVCLPHKNSGSGQPQTLECAFGLKDESGVYYGLNDTTSRYPFDAPTGSKLKVTGSLRKVDQTTNKYETEWTIDVVSVEVLGLNTSTVPTK